MSISRPSDFFFKSIFSRKNCQGGGELLLKNGTLDGYAYKLCCCSGQIYIWPDEEPLTLWGFLQQLPAKHR